VAGNNRIDNGPLANAGNFAQNVVDNVASQGAGIISTLPTAKFASGARCVLKINGRLIGFAFGVSWRIQTMATEIMTIDDWLPAELVPTRVLVEGTLSCFHIPGQGASAEFIQANLGNFLFQKYIQIEVRDSQTDALLFFAPKVMVTSRAEDFHTDALASMNLTWKAIGWKDERNPALPTNADTTTISKDNSNQVTIQKILPDVPSIGPGSFNPGEV